MVANSVEKILKPGGIAIIGSRNRLFNLVSLNKFTQIEIDLGNIHKLLQQSIICQEYTDQHTVIRKLEEIGELEPHPDSHPNTGINVSSRNQYSPAELCIRTRRGGLSPRLLVPINYHSVPVSMKKQLSKAYQDGAKYFETTHNFDHRLLPFCSTYLLAAQK